MFGKAKKVRAPGTNAEPPKQTKEEKDAWRKKQELERLTRLARYNAKHDSPDWGRKAVSKKSFKKNGKRARRFYAEANNG